MFVCSWKRSTESDRVMLQQRGENCWHDSLEEGGVGIRAAAGKDRWRWGIHVLVATHGSSLLSAPSFLQRSRKQECEPRVRMGEEEVSEV